MSAFSRLGFIALDISAIRPAKAAARCSLETVRSMPSECANDDSPVMTDEERAARVLRRQRARRTSR